MLSERCHPPIAYFQPVAETIGKPFTMSASTSAPKCQIRILQQPSDTVGVGQTFAKPLIMESDPKDKIFFVAILSDVQGNISSVQLGGNCAGNGYDDVSNNDGGGDSKRKRSSSSTQPKVEHAKFPGISVPTKGMFTLTVQAWKHTDDAKAGIHVATFLTEAFEVV